MLEEGVCLNFLVAVLVVARGLCNSDAWPLPSIDALDMCAIRVLVSLVAPLPSVMCTPVDAARDASRRTDANVSHHRDRRTFVRRQFMAANFQSIQYPASSIRKTTTSGGK